MNILVGLKKNLKHNISCEFTFNGRGAPGWNRVKLIKRLLCLDCFWAIFEYRCEKCKKEEQICLAKFALYLSTLHGSPCNHLNPEKSSANVPQFHQHHC